MFAELHYTTLHCITSYTLHGIHYTINCNLSHFTLHCTTRHYIALHHTTLHYYTALSIDTYPCIPLHTTTTLISPNSFVPQELGTIITWETQFSSIFWVASPINASKRSQTMDCYPPNHHNVIPFHLILNHIHILSNSTNSIVFFIDI